MKIIIVYASAGAGHFSAAEAVHRYLRQHCPEAELKLVDILEKADILFKFNYRFGYSFLIRKAPFLWRVAFWITSFKSLRFISRPIARFLNHINTDAFAEFLAQENPDCIISTHFLCSEISASLKKHHRIKSNVITVITDFGVHPFWVSKGTDLYIVASDITRRLLMREGVRAGAIRVSGIPTDPEFLKSYDKDSLCLKLGIDNSKFTVLLMTGSFGIGPLEEIAGFLSKVAQVLVVCAANKKLQRKLTDKFLPGVKVFGFVDNIFELMSVSDMIITKPGGLTISEILNMEVVPVFISAIPGQEAENVEVLRRYGVGLLPKRISDIKDIVSDFKNHPEKSLAMKDNIRKLKKPNTLTEIYNVVCKDSPGASC